MESNTFIIINNENMLVTSLFYNEYVLLLDYDNYINEIYTSYKNNPNYIYRQFCNDFPRAKYAIDNVSEKDILLFTDYFEFLIYQYNNDYNEFLCVYQAVMGSPLEKLYKIVNNSNNSNTELYIGEPKKKYNKKCTIILLQETMIYI